MLDIQGRPSVWDAFLAPQGGEDNKEPFKDWWGRNSRNLDYLHPQIAEQWIYRHWGMTHYAFLSLDNLQWRKESWPTGRILQELIKKNEALLPNEFEAESFQFQPWEPQLSIYSKGTWDYPILVLESETGFAFGQQLIPDVYYWLIEGHRRFRCLNLVVQQGIACADEHEVFVISYKV